MSHAVFVTGTDTGVGKTLVSAALVHAAAMRGLSSAGMKPVASGCWREHGRLLSEDAELLRAASGGRLVDGLVNLYAFEPPVAPHIAARQAGVAIDAEVIREAVGQARQALDFLVVEGVGGFRVPLDAKRDTADLVRLLDLPLVLVVGLRLGCINHALLTAEAIAARGLRLAGWVGNRVDAHMPVADENIETLRAMLPAPCLGLVPHLPVPDDFRTAAQALDIGPLLHAPADHPPIKTPNKKVGARPKMDKMPC